MGGYSRLPSGYPQLEMAWNERYDSCVVTDRKTIPSRIKHQSARILKSDYLMVVLPRRKGMCPPEELRKGRCCRRRAPPTTGGEVAGLGLSKVP